MRSNINKDSNNDDDVGGDLILFEWCKIKIYEAFIVIFKYIRLHKYYKIYHQYNDG